MRTRLLVATAGVTSFDWDETLPQSNAPARHWIDQVIVIPADDEAGVPVRYIEFTARARRVGSTRVLWDGIATDITRQKEAEVALTRSREELRELAGHLARVRESERAAIARELHDDVGSTLTGVKFQLQWLKGRVADDATLVGKLEQLNGLVDSAITASSRIMHDLRPAILDQGVVAALEWQARSFEQHTGLRCRFAAPAEEIALAPAQAIVVFRVCQEALNNVVKHAQASVGGRDIHARRRRHRARGARRRSRHRPGRHGQARALRAARHAGTRARTGRWRIGRRARRWSWDVGAAHAAAGECGKAGRRFRIAGSRDRVGEKSPPVADGQRRHAVLHRHPCDVYAAEAYPRSAIIDRRSPIQP